MPRAVKKETEEKLKETKSKATANSKKSSATKKTDKTKSISSASKKSAGVKIAKKSTKKDATVAKEKIAKKPVKKATKAKAKTTAKATVKKKVVKIPSLATKRKSTSKKVKEEEKDFVNILEYYDLPYRYNQTIVKILAQTPSILFVYWDISDIDRKNFELQYGQDFFSNTKPILTIHNIDKNYSFELDINDFANSWYIHISDSNCKYTVELGRKPITYTHFSTNYIYVTTSNLMDAPNNHILFENIHSNTSITYKNMKNKTISYKKLGSLSPIYKVSNINKLYENIYGTKILEDFSNTRLNNPSSGSISGAF